MSAAVPIEGSSVFVTGGAGTIGSTLVDLLLARGAAEVVVLDDFTRGRRDHLPTSDPRLVVREGDVRDADTVSELTAGRDLVFHLAALRITHCAADPRLALEVLANGTFNVMEAAVAHGVRKLVFSSSASVYGQATEFPTPETQHPWADETLYGAAKTFGEGVLRSFHKRDGLPGVALRYFNVYGPRMDAHGVYTEVLIRWMERIEAGEPPLIFGAGTQTMDFVVAADIARANVLAAEAPVATGAFNIASGSETSLIELAAALAAAMGRPDLTPEFGPPRAAVDVARRIADTSAAERELGFRAEIGLEEGLSSLVEWWRNDVRGTAVGA